VVAVLNLASRTQSEVPESTRNALETIAASIGGIVFRVNAEEALRNSQERLNLALKSSKASTWDRDITADKATWDEHIHAIFGLAPGSFSGKLEDFLGMVHPDDRERVRAEMTSAMDGSADYSTTYRVIWPNSSVHLIADRGKVYHDAAWRAMRMIGVCWDITEQKITDDALRESEARLSLAINAAGAGLWVTEPETGHVWFTPKTRELFHFAPDEGLNCESFFQVIHPEDREWVRQAMQQALQSGENLHFDYRIVLPDGSIRWIVARGQRYLKATGEPGRMMGVSLDITERKQMEETFKMERENLAEANAALRVLLRQREEDRRELEESLLTNVKTLVLPFAEKLKNTRLTPDQVLFQIIESHLKEITTPLLRTLSRKFAGLTPMEIQVANLIKDGRATKEIAAILVASEKTVLFHGHNLRRKLGLTQKKINLRSYLSSLP
jgi:PAS domain S-box-containing protein